MFPLAVEERGETTIVGVPPRNFRWRGALGMVAAPLVLVLYPLLLVASAGDSDATLLAPSDGALAVLAVLAGAFFVLGVVLIAAAGPLSRRTEVRFDRALRVVRGRFGEIPFDRLSGVRVTRGGALVSMLRLELVHRGAGGPSIGPYAPPASNVVSLGPRVAAQHSAFVAPIARRLNEVIGAPIDPSVEIANASPATNPFDTGQNTAAMLCYLPVQGVFLFASLYYLFAARDRPFVRFAAIQSLIQTGVAFVALIVAVVAGFVAVESTRRGSPAYDASVVALALMLCVVGIGNLVVHVVACVRAYRGRAWVMPWLRPLVRRWAPSDLSPMTPPR